MTVLQIITAPFYILFTGLLEVIGHMLPNVTDDLGFAAAMNQLMITGKMFGFIVPWNTLFLCLLIVLTIDFWIVVIRFIITAFRLARG